MTSESQTASAALFLGDHGALDFLNTVAQENGQPRDYWQSDDDVLAWLRHTGLMTDADAAKAAPGELLNEARQLREIIRALVAQKKAGQPVDAEKLNRFLASAVSYPQLLRDEGGKLHVTRIFASPAPTRLLAPVAELAASLLAQEDFALVRKCEHPECTLWFYDRTKSHRRRWCSMALCGNRAKVARFRQQQK